MARMDRRKLIKLAGTLPALGGIAQAAPARIVVLVDQGNEAARSTQAMRALDRLRAALSEKGAPLETVSSAEAAKGASLLLVLAAPGSALASRFAPAKQTGTVPE